MGDDDDRVAVLELLDQLFDPEGGDRIERRGRLVHEDDLRLHGNRPGDAKPLLLASGQRVAALLQLALDLVPQGGLSQRPFHQIVHLALEAIHLGAPGNVVIDALRKRIGFLEYHSHPAPYLDRIDPGPIDVDAVEANLALHPCPRESDRSSG